MLHLRRIAVVVVIAVILICLPLICCAQNPTIKTTGSGGIVIVQVDPDCPASDVVSIDLFARENPDFHKTQWNRIAHISGMNRNEYLFNWNTLSCHNNTYTLKARIKLKNTMLTAKSYINITNLSIYGCYPENVIVNTESETPQNITVSVVDNNLQCPMDITVTIYKLEDHNKPVRTLYSKGLVGDKHTLIWDLKDDKGVITKPAPYTYDVSINQIDTTTYAGSTYKIKDSCTYRSSYLKIVPVKDKKGVPLLDWYDFKFLDNGTVEDESDDRHSNTVYFMLIDSLGANARTGRMFVTNPDYTELLEYQISDLYCKLHKKKDCLRAGVKGIIHKPVFIMRADFMQYAGDYYSYMEIFDGHASSYRDHSMRRALSF